MIHFVGAGPGAADLITVRGMRLIEEADVIIYAGSLVNPALLTFAKSEPELYDSSVMTLEEITALMISQDKKGKNVVRLHSGDPSIYGAVREQMDVLKENQIRYDSCPGVSACFGAAAALDIEYTLPGISQSLIITRMEGRTPVPDQERMELMASHGTSMAVYLSAGFMTALQAKLLQGGYPPDTPAAIVYKATWPEEEKYLCTVGTLADTAAEHGITKTAIILVGAAVAKDVCERSKLYDPSFPTGYRKGS